MLDESEEDEENFIKSEAFKTFGHLYNKIDEKGNYIYYSPEKIIDLENERFLTIDEKDKQSDDGKYVYLDGETYNREPLQEGIQKIQTIDQYLSGSDEYYTTFDLNFIHMLRASDIPSLGFTTSEVFRDVVYFQDEFVIVRVSYNYMFSDT